MICCNAIEMIPSINSSRHMRSTLILIFLHIVLMTTILDTPNIINHFVHAILSCRILEKFSVLLLNNHKMMILPLLTS